MARFGLRYDPFMRIIASPVGMGPRLSGIDVEDGRVRVRMGWAFSFDAPLDSIAGVERVGKESLPKRLLAGVGVHGWRGRWRVNGAATPIVRLRFAEPQRARASGIPIAVSQLDVNPEDPDAFLLAIGHPA